MARTMPLECITLSPRAAKSLLFAQGEMELEFAGWSICTCTVEVPCSVGQSWKKEKKAELVWFFLHY